MRIITKSRMQSKRRSPSGEWGRRSTVPGNFATTSPGPGRAVRAESLGKELRGPCTLGVLADFRVKGAGGPGTKEGEAVESMCRAPQSALLVAGFVVAGFVAAGCGDRELRLQLVEGTVRFYGAVEGGGPGSDVLLTGVPTPFVPSVRARTGDRVAAATGVDLDGRFIVALPEDGAYVLEIARPDGTAVPLVSALGLEGPGAPVRIEVCEAESLVRTGTITIALFCTTFGDSEACLAARQRFADCRDPRDCGQAQFAVDRECRPPGVCLDRALTAFLREAVPFEVGCRGGLE